MAYRLYRSLCYWWLLSQEMLMWHCLLVCIMPDGLMLHLSYWICTWITLITSSAETWRAAVDAFPPFSHFHCAGTLRFVFHCLLHLIHLCCCSNRGLWGGEGTAGCCRYFFSLLSLRLFGFPVLPLFFGKGGNDGPKKKKSAVMERVGDCRLVKTKALQFCLILLS